MDRACLAIICLSCVIRTWTLVITRNPSTIFFHTCHVYWHYRPIPFCTTVSNLVLEWRSQGQCKVKPLRIFFSNSFRLIGMKYCMVLKQFKLNIPGLPLNFSERRERTAVVLKASENCNVGMYSDVCGSIWFKHGMMMDTIKLYILTLV